VHVINGKVFAKVIADNVFVQVINGKVFAKVITDNVFVHVINDNGSVQGINT
jgi:hypothetical protein